jgi:hypothetical protein
MNATDRIGWFLIALFFAIGAAFGLLGIRCAHALAPALVDRLVAAQAPLASRRDSPVNAQELAKSIAEVTKGNRQWSALLLTVAAHESALAQRIADGDCNLKIGECDGGRAWGLYQVHKNANNGDAWGSTSIDIQTREAARMLRAAFYQCNPRGALRPDWARATLSAYAGRRCDATWQGLDARLATLARIARALG